MKVVIMAGGKGTRFWPMSVEEKPKQFLAMTSDKTMIQQTYNRFREYLPQENIFVVTTKRYLPLVCQQLPELMIEQIIVEPEQRDSGPCIALTAQYFLKKGEDDVLVTAPSDQFIPDGKALMESLLAAEKVACKENTIVTLGIVPTRPETGYGYIETSKDSCEENVYKVETFIEKPSLLKAEYLSKRNNVYWNSGIFIWKPSTISYYMNLHHPEIWSLLEGPEAELDAVYSRIPKISIDYAVLEKADTVYMIPVQFEWDDVGTWTALERIHSVEEDGNIVIGNVHTISTLNSIIYAENHKTVVIGVQDLIIVATTDGLLICHKSNEQSIKTFFNP
jgi:mannose-1-phosphate guanylyltransferase